MLALSPIRLHGIHQNFMSDRARDPRTSRKLDEIGVAIAGVTVDNLSRTRNVRPDTS